MSDREPTMPLFVAGSSTFLSRSQPPIRYLRHSNGHEIQFVQQPLTNRGEPYVCDIRLLARALVPQSNEPAVAGDVLCTDACWRYLDRTCPRWHRSPRDRLICQQRLDRPSTSSRFAGRSNNPGGGIPGPQR